MLLFLLGCGPPGMLGWFVVVEGRVVDADGAAVPVAAVKLLTPDNETIAEVYTDPEGNYSSPIYGTDLQKNQLHIVTQAEGYAEGHAWVEVNLVSPELHSLRAGPGHTFNTVSRRLPTIWLAEEADHANVVGRVVDAVTGEGASRVELKLQHGWNAPTDAPAVDHTVTDSDGSFSFSADIAGMYTVLAEPDADSAGGRFPAILSPRGEQALGAISPITNNGLVVATVLWPSGPRDLDLHLSAPRADSQQARYHVWSQAPQYPPNGEAENAQAYMIREDNDGRGPETIVVRDIGTAGNINFTVFDVANADAVESTELGSSGAIVEVWLEGDLPHFAKIDPLEPATWWHPIELLPGHGAWYDVEQYQEGISQGDDRSF